MKRLVILSLLFGTGMVIGHLLFSAFNDENREDIVQANIKALALSNLDDEEKTKICWNQIGTDMRYGEMGSMIYCGDCQPTPCVSFSDQDICKIKK